MIDIYEEIDTKEIISNLEENKNCLVKIIKSFYEATFLKIKDLQPNLKGINFIVCDLDTIDDYITKDSMKLVENFDYFRYVINAYISSKYDGWTLANLKQLSFYDEIKQYEEELAERISLVRIENIINQF